jgi:hypothetical protein
LSNQHEEKGRVIIGEAALALALRKQNIDVPSLMTELGRMAEGSLSSERIESVFKARDWLSNLSASGKAAESVPYIKTISSLNDE